MTTEVSHVPEKKIQSAVRSAASFGPKHFLRRWWVTRLAGQVGEGVHIDRNVRLLRHPGNIHIGSWVMIKEGARICPAQPDANIWIGEFTTVGYHTYIFASAGIHIGANCLLAPFCYLVDSNHGIAREKLIREQEMSASPITRGDDVWLGTQSLVLPGVTSGQGAVVGAGSVIRESVPEYAIVAGAPAQVKGYR